MPLGRFQMTETKDWKGLTKKNHFGTIFDAKPQKATNFMIKLLAYNRGKTLETYLRQFPIKMFETNDDFTWQLIGSGERNFPLVEARYQGSVVGASDVGVGAGGAEIELVFEEDMFSDGNIIVGNKNELYQVRILAEPRFEGTQYVYTCQLMGSASAGMPGEELIAGTRWSKEFSPVEQSLSREVGEVTFTSPITMRNEWTTIRLKHKVGSDMYNRQLAMGLPYVDKMGNKKTATTWMHYADFRVEETFMEEKNYAYMYSRSNRNTNGQYLDKGKSGGIIKQGDGLRAQMEVSNTIFYDPSDFQLSQIESILLDLSESKLGFGDRMFMLRTGERGSALFSKAALDSTSGWTQNWIQDASGATVVSKTQSELHSNALSAGFQFTEYRFNNNIVVKVEVDPYYDDRKRNKIYHPLGGVAESYRFDILYIGTEGMEEPNIQLCKIKGMEEKRGYQWGPFVNPFTGEMGNPNSSFDEDAAVIHKMCDTAVVIFDPGRTASLIPDILQ